MEPRVCVSAADKTEEAGAQHENRLTLDKHAYYQFGMVRSAYISI